MAFRTVVVNSRCKLECRLNFLVMRGEVERKIYLSEISTLIVQSTAVSLTAALLCELIKRNVKVIFCDEKYMPQSELVPYYGAHNTSKRYKIQIGWKDEDKKRVWRAIVRQKIINQAALLLKLGFEEKGNFLLRYAQEVEDGDVTNREGHAAKVYFNCILPESTTRHTDHFINGCLNYGYAVLLSAITREIVSCGYLTQLGVWHDNEFNQFNLSCDLIEPFRPVVDEIALSLTPSDNFKKTMANLLNLKACIGEKNTTLDLAIKQYVHGVVAALEQGDETVIEFPTQIFVSDE